jgi:hypothetical protein
VLFSSAIAAALCAGPASPAATHQTMAHANMCMPATNDLTRTTNGIRNNTTGSRSVYCGFEVRDGTSDGYSLFGVTLRNYGAVSRNVSCYWTSGEPFSGGYSSVTTVQDLPADGGTPHIVYGDNLTRPNLYATLGLRCALPPGVAMDWIEIHANEPP